jgi:hypothetical protein
MNFHLSKSLRRTQIDAPNAMARIHKVLKYFSLKYHQSNKCYGGIWEKNKEEIHKELQDLDSIGSSHIEEILIHGNVELYLLSLFSLNIKQES